MLRMKLRVKPLTNFWPQQTIEYVFAIRLCMTSSLSKTNRIKNQTKLKTTMPECVCVVVKL